MIKNPIEFPEKIVPVLFKPSRYKVLRGGRGASKSWAISRYLIIQALCGKYRILCTREMQNSIKDSVHRLLVDQIHLLGCQNLFTIQKDEIRSRTGSEFLFKGLHHNIAEIKSTEGIDLCWVEEAEKVSEDSWTILIPTIRKEHSEIIISFNPEEENSATYRRFVKTLPPHCLSVELTYLDNPWFPEVLYKEMLYDKRVDFEKYEHVWLGKTKKYAAALIFKGKFRVEEFNTPTDAQFFFGLDFGYANDPTALVRCFIQGHSLYIDYETGGIGIEINELSTLLRSVPGTERWMIRADSARPDTINHLKQQGFHIQGAEKGKGSVEDGLEFIRSFEKIVIHPRCKHVYENFNNYKWKTDRLTGDILPIPVDSSNDYIDAIRYSLEPYIKKKTTIFEVDWNKARNNFYGP